MTTVSDLELYQLTEQVSRCLLSQQWCLASAESCTGGWLAKCCTDLAGSSAWFERGFITYSDESKQSLLGVSPRTLSQYGAISQQTVIEMAQGALAHSNSMLGVSITGIAGPNGGSIDDPVGTVWFAWAIKNGEITTCCHHFSGDRESVRRQAVKIALDGIIKNARASSLSMG